VHVLGAHRGRPPTMPLFGPRPAGGSAPAANGGLEANRSNVRDLRLGEPTGSFARQRIARVLERSRKPSVVTSAGR
jgi:hypothetical protein